MRHAIAVASLLLALLGGALLADERAVADDPVWLTSWDEAVKRSKETKKPILLFVTGSDWCGWCVKLDHEVFDTPEFAKWADERVVLLVVDFPHRTKQTPEVEAHNRAVVQRLGDAFRGLPAVAFIDETGRVLGMHGYEWGGPTVWLRSADAILGKR